MELIVKTAELNGLVFRDIPVGVESKTTLINDADDVEVIVVEAEIPYVVVMEELDADDVMK